MSRFPGGKYKHARARGGYIPVYERGMIDFVGVSCSYMHYVYVHGGLRIARCASAAAEEILNVYMRQSLVMRGPVCACFSFSSVCAMRFFVFICERAECDLVWV